MKIFQPIYLKRILLLLSLIGLLYKFIFDLPTNNFWDLEVYQNAIDIFNEGGSPYRDLEGLKFVYPPYVILVFSFFGKFFSNFVLISYLISFIFIMRYKFGRKIISLCLISSIVFFNLHFATGMQTGNITVFLHFAIIAAGNLKKNKFIFFIFVLIASLIKPYFILYLFLTFVIWHPNRKNLFFVGLTFLIFSLIFLSQLIFTPNLFEEFIYALTYMSIGDLQGNVLTGIGDLGFSPFRIITLFMKRNILFSLLIHTIFMSLFSLVYVLLIKKNFRILDKKDFFEITYFSALICITLLNPRMKVYDLWIPITSSLGIIFVVYENVKEKYYKFFALILSLAFLYFFYLYVFWNSFNIYIQIYTPILLSMISLALLPNVKYNKKIEVFSNNISKG